MQPGPIGIYCSFRLAQCMQRSKTVFKFLLHSALHACVILTCIQIYYDDEAYRNKPIMFQLYDHIKVSLGPGVTTN